MTWYSFDTWIVIIGGLSAVSCSLLGVFLVLRRMSMMGDAISHAVLPGLAIGYLMTGERTSLIMFVGAVIVGVLTAFFIQWITHLGKVDQGASMGIVFTSFFALGLVLIVKGADHVDLDPGCVLYGSLELAPLDVVGPVNFLGRSIEIPRTALTTGASLLLNLAVILLLFKEWKISSFDPALARTLGYSTTFLHYLLMILVAITTVAVFEAVGSILVIAMLIVPAACAAMIANRLGTMLLLGSLFALASAIFGHVAAITLPPMVGFTDTSTAGMMAVMAGFFFLLTALFSPRCRWVWAGRRRSA